MKVHELKTWPEPFLALWDGDKTYEVRKNDRDFGVGDELVLHEYRPDNRVGGPGGGYTPRTIRATVTYMTRGGDWGLPHNLCVMALRVLIRIGERPSVSPSPKERQPR